MLYLFFSFSNYDDEQHQLIIYTTTGHWRTIKLAIHVVISQDDLLTRDLIDQILFNLTSFVFPYEVENMKQSCFVISVFDFKFCGKMKSGKL